jgi:hypothetical protein
MIAALQVNNYPEAIKQMRDSLWYRQTPNRVDAMIKELKKNKKKDALCVFFYLMVISSFQEL